MNREHIGRYAMVWIREQEHKDPLFRALLDADAEIERLQEREAELKGLLGEIAVLCGQSSTSHPRNVLEYVREWMQTAPSPTLDLQHPIPVSAQKPQPNVPVLLFWLRGAAQGGEQYAHPEIGHWSAQDNEFQDSRGEVWVPTHWAPLPQFPIPSPPKEG